MLTTACGHGALPRGSSEPSLERCGSPKTAEFGYQLLTLDDPSAGGESLVSFSTVRTHLTLQNMCICKNVTLRLQIVPHAQRSALPQGTLEWGDGRGKLGFDEPKACRTRKENLPCMGALRFVTFKFEPGA